MLCSTRGNPLSVSKNISKYLKGVYPWQLRVRRWEANRYFSWWLTKPDNDISGLERGALSLAMSSPVKTPSVACLYSMTATAVAAGSRGAGYAQVMRARMLGGSPFAMTSAIFNTLPGYCAHTVSVATSVRAPEKSNSEQRLRARVAASSSQSSSYWRASSARVWVRVRVVATLCDMMDGWMDGWMDVRI